MVQPVLVVIVMTPAVVVLMTAHGNVSHAVEAMKLGASKLPIRTRFVERHELGGD